MIFMLLCRFVQCVITNLTTVLTTCNLLLNSITNGQTVGWMDEWIILEWTGDEDGGRQMDE